MWAMPNVMVALPNIGGALYSTPQSLTDAHYYVPCSNTAKTRKPLKVAGVPQTPERISAASGPKFTILYGHVEEILLLNKFFFRLSIRALVAKIARHSCAMVRRWRFLATFSHPVFAASRVQHISDLHLKFALRPHHGRHPICDG